MKLKVALALTTAIGLLFTGCSPTAGGDGTAAKKLNVVVAFYPLQFASDAVAGDRATVTNLTAPGAEPHDLELTPKQVGALASADLVVYLKGFQHQVDTAVEQQHPKNVIDVATAVQVTKLDDKGGLDPHVWLDPVNMAAITAAIEAKLASIDPAGKDIYAANLAKATGRLTALDDSFKAGLASCARNEIITTHEAFGYLAARYRLTQIGISGLSPDAEPSPARIAEVQALAKQHGITTIFYETLASPAVASSIAGDLGLKTDVLDPIEGITKDSRGTNYVEVMQSNLTALKAANGCA